MRKALVALALLSASVTAADLPLIPLPKEVKTGEGSFAVTAETGIRFDAALANEAKVFSAELKARTGHEPKAVREELRIMLPSEIRLDLDSSLALQPGGYTLEASPKGVVIKGKDATGAWNGTRTLLQLLPLEGGKSIPAVSIKDEPRFGWRGMHLDVGRHFFPVENIKGFIDWLAFHKMNTFHWHLTEDQGWRIEIKKYPKLTEIGAWRDSSPPYGNRNSDDGKRYGGFYTQEQIKEVVAYAKARHITIVPEIDMPGHMAAAIAAYPQFGNSDIPGYAPKVIGRWGVHPYTLAPTEEAFRFVDDVLTEVCALFPSEYIHIGGDEAPKGQWESSPRVKELMKKVGLKNGHDVQSYFIKRVEKMLEKKGRKLIGWDEIREGGLAPSATVMCWQGDGVKAAVDSVREGHDVVMAPNHRLYFDHYQRPEKSELAKGPEFETIGGFRPVSNVYDYDPVPTGLTPDQQKHVLGVQGQLWTEYMHDWKKVEYMAFPRIAALAEIAWSPADKKNYEGFRGRLDGIMKHYDAAKVNRAEPYDPPKRETADGSTVTTSLGIYQEHWPEFAYDGKPETFFWVNRELKENDHLTVAFKEPKSGKVTVKTGGEASQNGDKLDGGVLEASADGSTWKEVAAFEGGAASGALPTGTKQLRIRVTKPQKNWLIIHEIEVQP
ncbi:family 20 glycosylhydrolase [Luteolibacter arcticus]|uniref:beta-N-acetylhexosaminidase n=1 Tax=Luteolibacter arcticus TaxID=1581411 RepID=A0ABT3GKS9_9BACT|nr:family 20 glycosylhydrolase [Luteolibacter arcticus]MCW1924095.1 family 20 glycosylhydrolase [Luteolibacter arcticus]